jgi:hypothetical protein
MYSLIVGTPVTNCQAGANADVTDASGGSITIGESWSVGFNIGLDFGVLKIDTSGQWTQTKSIEYDQTITIVVHPGQMVCQNFLAQSISSTFMMAFQGVLVANVQYKQTSGTMQIGKGRV